MVLGTVHISLQETRMAAARAEGFGALAQLGEHLLCKQGVGGSIPPGSTSRPAPGRAARMDWVGSSGG